MKKLTAFLTEDNKEILDPKTRVIGTIEPDWNNDREFCGPGIADEALAFIFGAIKKYGSYPECYHDLRLYILEIAKGIKDKKDE